MLRPEIGLSVGRTLLREHGRGGGDAFPSLGFTIGGRLAIGGPLELVGRSGVDATLVDGSRRILCGGDGAPCLRTTNRTILLQLHLGLGIGLRF